MKKFLITLLIVLPTISMATSNIDQLCFKAIQAEMTASETGNDLITLQDITAVENSKTEYKAYAWIEDRTDAKVWPYHSFWDVVVVKSADKCSVKSLVFVEGNM